MKLKLSNLLAIIAVIFFLYYYFIQVPQEQQHQVPAEEGPVMAPLPEAETGVTPLLPPRRDSSQEAFSVTPINDILENTPIDYGYTEYTGPNSYDPDDVYDMAGNVRPDNVMFAGNEPATSF